MRRLVLVLAGIAIATFVAVGAAAALLLTRGGGVDEEAYLREVRPLILEWQGSIGLEVLTCKADTADIDPSQLGVTFFAGQVSTLEDIQQNVAAVDAPDRFQPGVDAMALVTLQLRGIEDEFRRMLTLMVQVETLPLDDMFTQAASTEENGRWFSRVGGAFERWDNVQELRAVATQYDELRPAHALASFLEDVALVTDVDEYEEQADAVTLITLHAAKGLEFPIVFIVGLEEGILPHVRSFDDPAQMEEERRLCYVGMTRAKQGLYLVHAFRRAFGGHNPPSRFLSDVPKHLATTPRRVAAPTLWPSRGDARPSGRYRQALGETEAPAPPAEAFAAGDHVRHPKFGEGIVVSCQPQGVDQLVTVAFQGEAGIKKLLLSFALLERLESTGAA